jgi:hypothetical protein
MEENIWSVDEMKQTLSLLKKTIKNEREQYKKVKLELALLSATVLQSEQNLKEKV